MANLEYDKKFEESLEDIAEKIAKDSFMESVAPRLEKELSELKEFGVFDKIKDKTKEFVSEIIQHILSDENFLKKLSNIVIHQIDVQITPRKD